jgi:hypothetical protein
LISCEHPDDTLEARLLCNIMNLSYLFTAISIYVLTIVDFSLKIALVVTVRLHCDTYERPREQ